jgi:enoyl-[acyl-carrier-protein] reductase (NADH)
LANIAFACSLVATLLQSASLRSKIFHFRYQTNNSNSFLNIQNKTKTMATTASKRVALITGAASGMGRAFAIRLAKDGIAIAVNYVGDPSKADQVVNEIKETGGTATAFHADVSNVAAIIGLFNDVAARIWRY